jgi:hypothetical protein
MGRVINAVIGLAAWCAAAIAAATVAVVADA